MPIKIKIDVDWGCIFYLKADMEQLPHMLVGVVTKPGNTTRLQLSYCGTECEVFDFEASTERDLSMIEKYEDDDV